MFKREKFFVNPVEYFVRIERSKPSFMQFLAHVPTDYYRLVLINGNEVCGVIVGTEIMEYVTNELNFYSIEYISLKDFLKLQQKSYRTLGDYST